MRLPWPFGRRTQPDGPSPDSRAGAGPAPASAPADTTAPPTGAWASLPPIQRTVADAPLVAPSAPFLDAVPGHRHLPPIVQALGHETGPAAPPGLVVARPSAVPRLTSHAPMPVQRRAAHAGDAAPEPVAEAWSEPIAEAAPVRSLATVAPAATVTPSARPLTRAPDSPAPVASRGAGVQRVAAPSSTGPSVALTSPAPTSAPGSAGAPLPAPRGTAPARRSRWAEAATSTVSAPGLGAPIAAAQASPAPAESASPAPSVGAAAATPSSSTPESPGVQRRTGLGAPMHAAPTTAVASRMPLSGRPTRPAPGLATAPAAGMAASSLPGVDAGVPGVPSMAAEPASRALPVLPVARRASSPAKEPAPGADLQRVAHAGHDHAATAPGGRGAPGIQRVPSTAAAPTVSAGPATAATRSASAAAPMGAPAEAMPSRPPAVRPTVGANPLRPRVAVQRQADEGVAGAEPPTGPAAAPVAARWSQGADLPDTISQVPPASAADEPVPLERLATGPATAAAPATPAPPPMREITFPAPGTVATPMSGLPGLTDLATPTIQRSTPASAPATATSARPGTTAHAPLALARPPAPVAPAFVEGSVPGPSVRRIAPADAGSAGSAGGPVVQTSRAGASSLPQLTVTPVIQREEAAAPAPAGATTGDAAQRSDKELDQLAQDLFGRFRTRLRSEVIQEREARGLGFDAF